MKTIINNTEFTEITYILDGEEMSGLLIHDIKDENRDGDMIIGNGAELPETEEDAAILLENETGLPVSDFDEVASGRWQERIDE